MALAVYSLITLAELKSYLPVTGTGKDLELEHAIARASLDIEGEGVGGRRLIYRGPVEDDDNVVAAAALVNGALALAGQPNSAGRTLVVTKTDTDRGLTAGTLTVTGTVGGVAGSTETFDLTAGEVLHGVKFFTAVSAAALTGVTGAGAGDTVKVGTSPGYTEFYDARGGSEIIPIEWPIQNVIEVNEDADRVFGSSTALVVTTDYEIRSPSSIRRRIARVDDRLDYAFIAGRRSIRARMSAGYKASAAVPWKIKGVCLEMASWHFKHAQGGEYGLVSRSDGMGSITRSGPPILSAGMKAELADYYRAESSPTAERDFDLEAA